MSSVIATVIEHYQKYFADSLYPVLFLICLLWLLLNRKEKGVRDSLLWPSLIIPAIIFFPLTAFVMIEMVGSLVYYRVFWMIAIPMVIAYAGVQFTFTFSGKYFRIFAALIVCALIILSGSFLFTDTFWMERMNYFKLPTEAIYVADAVSAHASETGIENPKAAVDSFLTCYIRQYDAGIRLAYGRNMVKGDVEESTLYKQINNDDPDLKELVSLTRNELCNYLVLPASLEADDALGEYSFAKIAEAARYTVYFDEESAYQSAIE